MSSILVVDDENSILESLNILLGDKYDVTTCDSGLKALEITEKTNFDIVISDVQLGDINGNEVLQKVKERCKETEVIMISAYPKKEYIFDAGKHGACDYLVKPYDKDEMLNLIESVLERKKLNKISSISNEPVADKYTAAELQVMRLLAEDKSNKEIAGIINKDETYVKNALRVIYPKLGVKNRTEAKIKILTILREL